MERAETIIAACRDTMLTTLEKIGGQSWPLTLTRPPFGPTSTARALCRSVSSAFTATG